MKQVFNPAIAVAESRSGRNRQLRMLAPVLALIVAAYVCEAAGILPSAVIDIDYIYITAALLVCAGLVYTLAQWRCPGCRKLLWYHLNPKHCPGCGIQLEK
jgi:hypothetical protein